MSLLQTEDTSGKEDKSNSQYCNLPVSSYRERTQQMFSFVVPSNIKSFPEASQVHCG